MINKKYIESKDLEPHDVFYLGLVLQNATEDMVEELIKYLGDVEYRLYEELKLTTHIKAKSKKDHIYKSIRLTKKGKEFYRNAQILDYTKEDEALLEHLTAIYDSVDKSIGNEVKVKQLLAWFCAETGYSRRMVYRAITTYITSLADQNKEMYIAILENLIWKPLSVFSTKWTLADSKLYQFIQEHKKEMNASSTN